MSNVPFYVIKVGDREIKVVEPIRQKRDRFWPWEYWALKEHQMMKERKEWVPYIDNVVMVMDIPIKQTDVQEIDNRPLLGTSNTFDINVRVPLSRMSVYEKRMGILGRNWREFLLYPSLQEGLIADKYYEITEKYWPLDRRDDGE